MAEKNKLSRKELVKASLKKNKESEQPTTSLDKNDVKSIDPQLQNLRDFFKSLLNAHRRTISASIEFGEQLHVAKVSIGHGGFIDYIEKNKAYLGFDRRAASNYLRIYQYQQFIGKDAKTIQEAISDIRAATKELSEPESENRLEKEINPLDYNYTKAKKLYLLFKKNGKGKKGLKKPVADYIKRFIVEEIEKENNKHNEIISNLENDLKLF
ncbi:hypothetical protein JWG45_17565 [Leptospira sp. 201903070]|uniref:DUF3102 domain-containing protein n=1 Tax=Leptospira ainlahdjerensis TaxID=2810033 RepID=A0ABS2UI02_9LEPT|nr:hypothetical protein [Leptospira ainlahdjerensis]MBM9578957.1 hypothetical protein [Leptospira ainlahdjerensis]